MNHFIKLFLFLITLAIQVSCLAQNPSNPKEMMIRIAEIEVNESDLEEYKKILQEESEASIRLEQGVISIFPMYEQQNPNVVKILEIYANKEAYQAHLQTPHFLKYKTTTLNMVRSLKLIEMDALDPESMGKIFKKLKK
ncbi:antibiotic biosynthesis monooxygenase [Algoriphagus sp.]|uniref:putative quinol monooxygenase n=1 Tax=Algoriphagus sp. TaxID=1872435 RepID=UPI0025D98275|nr:antibiotic biosynthesis monooxygenase [Algoriphagus sp.]